MLELCATWLQVYVGDTDRAGQAGAALPAGIVCQESADGTQASTAVFETSVTSSFKCPDAAKPVTILVQSSN